MKSLSEAIGTGQKVIPDTGLLDYNARMYSSELGRFTQPDTIIPGAGNPQAWNRYAYTLNNPVKYTDPSGHRCKNEGDEDMNGYCFPDEDNDETLPNIGNGAFDNMPKQSGFDPNFLLNSFDGKGFSNRRCNVVPEEFRTANICYVEPVFEANPVTAKEVGNLINLGGDVIEFAHFIKGVHLPGYYGAIVDTTSQIMIDWDEDYSTAYRASRVVVNVVEGQAISVIAGAVAAIYAVPGSFTGIGDVVIVTAVYASTSYVLDAQVRNINEAIIYPPLFDFLEK